MSGDLGYYPGGYIGRIIRICDNCNTPFISGKFSGNACSDACKTRKPKKTIDDLWREMAEELKT